MNETEKKIILTLAKNGALNIYRLEKHANLKHATAFKNVKNLEQNGLIRIVNEDIFKTGLRTRHYWLTWSGIVHAYSLGVDVETLKKHVYEMAKDKLDESKRRDVEGFFEFLKETSREDVGFILSCYDFSVSPPKPKMIPLPVLLENFDKVSRIFSVMLKNHPFKTELKAELLKLLDQIEQTESEQTEQNS